MRQAGGRSRRYGLLPVVSLKKFARSPGEIAFRLRQEAMNLWLAKRPPSRTFTAPAPLPLLPDPQAAIAPDIERLADQIVAHRFPLLGIQLETGPQIRWRRDYQRGIETGPIYFRRIPYLDVTQVGDHKVIWELNRHQHWVVLAQAYRRTGQSLYLSELVSQWESWIQENPFQHGINWCSALEVAFRSLSWVWTYHLVGDRMPAEFLQELARHGWHLEYNLSYYFSPNTHLLGEAVALHALGVLFPCFPRAERWRELGHRVVTTELSRQVLPDGAHFEQSTYYHVYAMDFFLLHYVLAGRPAAYLPVLQKMGNYLDAMLGSAGSIPLLGDDDGGRLFHPYGVHTQYGRATRTLCGALCSRPDWIGEDLTLVAAWLGEPTLEPKPRDVPAKRLFPHNGAMVFEEGERFLAFDVGGFGPYQAGHSHSDSLSIYLRVGSDELLIDPGTYEYVGEQRNRFRGSAAHNTVRLDGFDQAEPAGSFGWVGRPVVGPLGEEGGECRYRGFTHRRWIQWGAQTLRVVDEVDGPSGDHEVEQFWHAGVPVTRVGADVVQLGTRATLTVEGEAEIEEGWRSKAYGTREPAAVVVLRKRCTLPLRLETVIAFT